MDGAGTTAAGELPQRARLSVRWGPIYPGGHFPVTLRLEGERVVIAIEPGPLSRSERSAVKRLLGQEALEQLAFERAATIEFRVREARLSFSNAPGRRTAILVQLPGKPKFLILFLDMSPVEDAASGSRVGVLAQTGKVLAGAGTARDAREAWRQALQRAGAPHRGEP